MRRHSAIKAVVIGFVMTFFPIFDVPVFWPILLLYWFVLFFVTMKRQIKHMIKYRYIPFTTGKKARASDPLQSHQALQATLDPALSRKQYYGNRPGPWHVLPSSPRA